MIPTSGDTWARSVPTAVAQLPLRCIVLGFSVLWCAPTRTMRVSFASLLYLMWYLECAAAPSRYKCHHTFTFPGCIEGHCPVRGLLTLPQCQSSCSAVPQCLALVWLHNHTCYLTHNAQAALADPFRFSHGCMKAPAPRRKLLAARHLKPPRWFRGVGPVSWPDTYDCGFVADARHRFGVDCAIELPTAAMVRRWVTPAAAVLEVGARFGQTTCEIATAQNNSGRLVAIEPDAEVWADLTRNLEGHNCRAHVLQGVVATSAPGLVTHGYATRTVPVEGARAGGGRAVAAVAWEALEQELGIQFDTVLVDCEGCITAFLADWEGRLPQLRLVLIEADMPVDDACTTQQHCVNYGDVYMTLKAYGFVNVDSFNDCDFTRSRLRGVGCLEAVSYSVWMAGHALHELYKGVRREKTPDEGTCVSVWVRYRGRAGMGLCRVGRLHGFGKDAHQECVPGRGWGGRVTMPDVRGKLA